MGNSDGEGVGAGDDVGAIVGNWDSVGDVVGPSSVGDTLGRGDCVTGAKDGLLLERSVGETVGAGDGAGLAVGRCDAVGW